MHSFYSPANALYELIIGVTCLVTLFGGVFTIYYIFKYKLIINLIKFTKFKYSNMS